MKKYIINSLIIGFILGIVGDLIMQIPDFCIGYCRAQTYIQKIFYTPIIIHLIVISFFIIISLIVGFVYGKIKNRKNVTI